MTLPVEHWKVETDGELTETVLRRELEARGYHVTLYVYPPLACISQITRMKWIKSTRCGSGNSECPWQGRALF
jgi:hypothetical protein